MKKLYVTLPFLLAVLFGYSQTPFYQQPVIASSSPDVAALSKVTDIPVDYSNGTANLTIPLYTIKTGGITVPIAITYNTGGIKVNDMAGLIGLGWNIDFGGMIQVNQEIFQPGQTVAASQFKQQSDISSNWGNAAIFCSAVNNGLHEKQRPEYHYHFGNYSGSFFYDINEQVHIKSDNQNLAIVRLGFSPLTDAATFEIIDDNGIQYYFQEPETVSDVSGDGNNGYVATSGLLLSKIVDPNTNRSVLFKYKEGYSYTNYTESESIYYLSLPCTSTNSTCSTCLPITGSSDVRHLSLNTVSQIDSIIFPSGYIKFNALSDRSDPMPVRIVNMVVSDNTGRQVKQVNFNQSYFVSTGGVQSTDNYRLRLDSVCATDPSGVNKVDQYSFLYNNMAFLPPYRHVDPNNSASWHICTGVDYWGYYNGQDGNPGLIPWDVVPAADKTTLDLNLLSFNGVLGYRKPDPNYAQAFSLQKVIYPTGACVRFVFESNDVPGYALGDTVGGIRIRYIDYFDHFNAATPSRQQYFQYDVSRLPIDHGQSAYIYDKTKTKSCPDANGEVISWGNNYTRNMTSDPLGSMSYFRIAPFYSQVEEYGLDSGTAKRKTIYYYDTVDQFYEQTFPDLDYGGLLLTDRGWLLKDLLTKVEQYKWNGGPNFSLVKKEVNTYTNFFENAYNIGLMVYTPDGSDYMGLDLRSTGQTVTDQQVVQAYGFFNIQNTTGMRRLTNKTVTDYLSTDSLVTSTDYVYNQYYYLQSSQTTNSKGQTCSQLRNYPFDKSTINSRSILTANASAAIDTMLNRNMLAAVIEQEDFNSAETVPLKRIRKNYRVWGAGSPIVQLETVDEQIAGLTSETRFQVFNYDNFGNVLERSKTNDIHEVYIYGYNDEYPVAKIIGGSYATAIALVNSTTLNNPAVSDASMRTELNNLRTGLPGALVSTYTFLPLTGMTSEGAPNGLYTYYQYDQFNRASLVLDNDNNITKQFSYQYAARPVVTNPIFYSSYESFHFAPSCPANYAGNNVIYTVHEAKYSSAVSQNQADSFALADLGLNGPTYASTYSTCNPIPMANVTYTNSVASQFRLTMTNTSTNVSYVFNLSASVSGSPLTLGQVPLGTYNVGIIPLPDNGSTHNYQFNTIIQNASYDFNSTNVSVNCASCAAVTIN